MTQEEYKNRRMNELIEQPEQIQEFELHIHEPKWKIMSFLIVAGIGMVGGIISQATDMYFKLSV